MANHLHEKEEHVIEDDEEVRATEPVNSAPNAAKDASPIPDGGFQAWLQVLGSFFLLFNSWCVPNVCSSNANICDSSSVPIQT